MLPDKWRIVVRNNTGGNITGLDIKATPWKFDANGAVEYGTQIDLNVTAPTDGNFQAGTEENNATAKNFGIKGIIQAISSIASPTGAVELYIEWPNAAGDYPSGLAGAVVQQDCVQIAALSVVQTNARGTNFTYE